MKKTLNVYFEKTYILASLKTMALMFAFTVCFLSFSSDASAQTFNTNPFTNAQNGKIAQVDLTFAKQFEFTSESSAAAQTLRSELQDLHATQPTNGVLSEANYASKVYFLEDLVATLGKNSDVADSFQESYQRLANYTSQTFSISVDIEGIFRTYAGLVN